MQVVLELFLTVQFWDGVYFSAKDSCAKISRKTIYHKIGKPVPFTSVFSRIDIRYGLFRKMSEYTRECTHKFWIIIHSPPLMLLRIEAWELFQILHGYLGPCNPLIGVEVVLVDFQYIICKIVGFMRFSTSQLITFCSDTVFFVNTVAEVL